MSNEDFIKKLGSGTLVRLTHGSARGFLYVVCDVDLDKMIAHVKSWKHTNAAGPIYKHLKPSQMEIVKIEELKNDKERF